MGEYTLNKMKEVVTGDRVLKDLKVEEYKHAMITLFFNKSWLRTQQSDNYFTV